MRCLDKNKSQVIYALFDSTTEATEVVNGKTLLTGRRVNTYKDAVITGGNIDENGRANWYPSGVFNDYLLNIMMDADCPFDPLTILWIGFDARYYTESTKFKVGDYCVNGKVFKCINDTTGEFNAEDWVEVPHNYIVKEVHHSLNNVKVYANESQS